MWHWGRTAAWRLQLLVTSPLRSVPDPAAMTSEPETIVEKKNFFNGREVTAELVHRQLLRLVKCGLPWAEDLEVEDDRSQEEDITSHGKTPTILQVSMTNNRR